MMDSAVALSKNDAPESTSEQIVAPKWAKPIDMPLADMLASEPISTEENLTKLHTEIRMQAPPELLKPVAEVQLPKQTSVTEAIARHIEQQAELDLQAPQSVAQMQQTAGDIEASETQELKLDKSRLPQVATPQTNLVSTTRSADAADNSTKQAPSSSRAEIYKLRFSPMKAAITQQNGGDERSETAVQAALTYLARVQQRDGSWSAASGGAGRETQALGENRGGTGAKADTAMTGLAILAFLGAGQTHQDGEHRANLIAGLEYLIAAQMPSGDLAGSRQIGNAPDVRFARMYSHGIALLSLAEAYALTGDERLANAVSRGCNYTLAAQNPYTGGWRYDARYTGDPGDLSQFGWQALALQSARRGGIQIPEKTLPLCEKFLNSVATGNAAGLATYRPVPGQRPSASMTAEAFAARSLLGLAWNGDSKREATAMLLDNLPGQSEENLYYWYYATIAMYQQQGESWQRWNAAMKPHLVGSQITRGPDAGSWNPDGIWGGYGGRIYSTAMACMCLEVYYRFLPMYE